ncbi:MAG: 3-hydroxyacyl-CoA dehydrogenase NAD-binding domain-containing protein [Gammaproteobacteria bacterium]
MEIKKVLIIGAGSMGYQIALQFAIGGFQVALYDVKADALEFAMTRIKELLDQLIASKYVKEDKQVVLGRINATTDKTIAAKDVDLVSESILEDPEVKGKVFAEFSKLCPPHAIFTSNTSQLIPSMFASKTGRPSKFLAWHFGNPVWKENYVDIMPHPETDPKVVEEVVKVSDKIRQVPFVFHKEFPGYAGNHLLKAYTKAAMELAANGILDYKDIDRIWMIAEGKDSLPPFAKMDMMSLDTSCRSLKVAAELTGDEFARTAANFLEEEFVKKGKLGVKSGEGFYKYPNPEFAQPGFIKKFTEE